MPWTLRMTLYTMIIGSLPYLYIYLRLGHSLKILLSLRRRTTFLVMTLLYLLFHLYPLLYLVSVIGGAGRDFFVNEQTLTWADYLIHFPYWIGFITVIELLTYFILIDIIQLLLKRFATSKKICRSKLWAHGRIILYIVFLFYVSLRSYYDTNTIRHTSYTMPLAHMPESIASSNFTFIADLQIDRYTTESKISDFREKMKQTNPDFIFFAGDLITSGRAFTEKGLSIISEGDTAIKRIACMGDHDFWHDREAISSGLEAKGWDFLQNRHQLYQYDDKKILVTGITQIYSRRISPSQLDVLLASAPDADIKILLTHQPATYLMQGAAKYGYHLFLAGHTHGGQMVFKPLGFTITPTQFENEIYTGYHAVNGLHVVVTNGIGLTLVPLRFRAYAEIVNLNFTEKKFD
jgi:predicted MPP superfamily phosphohydrolase